MNRIVILGAAESGVGAAILAKEKGYEAFVSDMGTIKPHYQSMLTEAGIPWEQGGHSEEKILSADEIVKSPGIPQEAPLIKKAIYKGIPIISEIEWASRFTTVPMICITGSNGKTTTTSLLHHILSTAGINAGLAGNIGHSLALQVAHENHDCYVIELSSFQLDNMYDFRAHVAILLNITPDHLDRYGFQMQNYVDAKMRITRNQGPEDAFIYWKDDPIIEKELNKYSLSSHLLPFSDVPEEGSSAWEEKETLFATFPAPTDIARRRLALPGRHNVRNALAAIEAARFLGLSSEDIARGLETFSGVEHRLEHVEKINGVTYVNDSKATNVDACIYALESMTAPVVLILGGKDKGNDYEPLKPLLRKKCAALVYLGADNKKLHDAFDELGLPVRDTHSMPDCVAACRELAPKGSTVLLSPCCASFDLFHNMEDRGEQFKSLVRALPTENRL